MPDSPQPNLSGSGKALLFGFRFWIVAALTGVGAGLAGGLLMKLLRFVQHHAYSYAQGNFLIGVEGVSAARRVCVMLLAGGIAAAALWLIHRYLGEGSGLSGAIWFHSGKLPTLKTLAEGVLSIAIVGMGAPLGREGAPKEAGAAFASRFARWAKLTRAERRLLAACGAGAGMAAVYNLPFGGALFGLEVLLGTVQISMVIPAVFTSLIAVSVSWLFLPNQPSYSVPAFAFSPQQLLWAAITGPLIGLACVPYIRLISWAGTHKPKGRNVILLPVAVLTAIGAMSIAFPQLLGNGRNIVEIVLARPMGIALILTLVFLRPIVTAGCLRAGAPGGLFTPTMTFGALLGSLAGQLFQGIWPGAPEGAYALLGSGAALAAATQGPASSLIMVLELTRWTDAIMVPLMLAVVTATIATRLFESRSVYSGRMRVEIPCSEQRSEEKPEFTVPAAALYPAVLECLLRMPADANRLFVEDQHCGVSGVIRRDTLSQSVGEYGDPRETATAYDLAERISPDNKPSNAAGRRDALVS